MSRIFIVPVIIALLYPNQFWLNVAGAVVFMLASVTDYYDGYFARKYNAISNFGKFMDPIADKILVTSILIMLVHVDRVDVFMVIIILARDTFISGIRSVAAADQIIIDAKPAGKWKTALQMVAIPAVMIDETWNGINFTKIGYWALWISVILSLTSGFQYYWGYVQSRRQKPSAPGRG